MGKPEVSSVEVTRVEEEKKSTKLIGRGLWLGTLGNSG